MASDPRAACDRLREMADSGALDELCARHGLDLLVVHGSVLDPDADPADLDVAVWPRPGGDFDLLAFIGDLGDAIGDHGVDVMDLSRAGVAARGLALEHCEPLYERVDGLFARRQMTALLELLDTTWMRDLNLRTLATS